VSLWSKFTKNRKSIGQVDDEGSNRFTSDQPLGGPTESFLPVTPDEGEGEGSGGGHP
jgi:hypothetical protein